LKRIRKAKDAVRFEIAVARARVKHWKEALQTADEIEANPFRVKALVEIAKLQVTDGDEVSGMTSFQKAIDTIKDKGKAERIDYYRLGDSDPELLYQVMKAEGEVGITQKALQWVDKQDSVFVKAMALTGLAEGLVNRQKPQAKHKDKQSNAQAAEKDFQIAEFYRRTGHHGSAHFYYELVTRRYPDSPFAEKAKDLLKTFQKDEVP
jgi:hypothetical protein